MLLFLPGCTEALSPLLSLRMWRPSKPSGASASKVPCLPITLANCCFLGKDLGRRRKPASGVPSASHCGKAGLECPYIRHFRSHPQTFQSPEQSQPNLLPTDPTIPHRPPALRSGRALTWGSSALGEKTCRFKCFPSPSLAPIRSLRIWCPEEDFAPHFVFLSLSVSQQPAPPTHTSRLPSGGGSV